MDNIYYSYNKIRKDFGRHMELEMSDPEVLMDVKPNAETNNQFIARDPVSVEVGAMATMSEHWAYTESIGLKNHGMTHLEGGWPRDVDTSEVESKKRHIRKIEKDDDYIKSIKTTADIMETFIKQNAALDVYEQYFSQQSDARVSDLVGDTPSATVTAVFKDPHRESHRAVGHISWLPRDGSKIAVAYCSFEFQGTGEDFPTEAYIWDLANPNEPVQVLKTQSPLLCIEFNPMETHILAAGCYDGTVALFDTRKEKTIHSHNRVSHKDPVYGLKWIQSKNDTQFMTCSTDGQVMTWDNRFTSEPIEMYSLDLTEERGDVGKYIGVLGAESFDYNQSYGPKKFMFGTEQGIVVSCSSRSKTKSIQIDRPYYAHHGPVYAVERNPFNTKYFLTVGDWTAKIWLDDLQHQIITTSFQTAYLTDGCWSVTRPAVFFTTRMDGVLDIWDLLYKHNAPALSVQIADCPLRCVRQGNGQHLAVGDDNGFTHLIKLSDSLSGYRDGEKQSPAAERDIINAMFDSESKRVINLQDMRKEASMLKKQQAVASENRESEVSSRPEISEELKELEADFLHETDAGDHQSNDDRNPPTQDTEGTTLMNNHKVEDMKVKDKEEELSGDEFLGIDGEDDKVVGDV